MPQFLYSFHESWTFRPDIRLANIRAKLPENIANILAKSAMLHMKIIGTSREGCWAILLSSGLVSV